MLNTVLFEREGTGDFSPYWYALKASSAGVEISLLLPNIAQPLLELKLPNLPHGGLQSPALMQHNVRLKPELEYQWVVALVPDPGNRSKDVVASGVIKRIAPTPDLQKEMAAASPRDLPGILAGQGIWFDALEPLLTRGTGNPPDVAASEQATALLDQVGLMEVRVKP